MISEFFLNDFITWSKNKFKKPNYFYTAPLSYCIISQTPVVILLNTVNAL